MDQSFRDLLEASSLGTQAARRIRSSTPSEVVDDVRHRMERRRPSHRVIHLHRIFRRFVGIVLLTIEQYLIGTRRAVATGYARNAIRSYGDVRVAVQMASDQAKQRVLIEAELDRVSLRHRRLPAPLRWVPLLAFGADALLLLYFFTGVTDVSWANPFSGPLVFAVLLAAMVTGIGFMFFRFTGERLQQYKDDSGVIPLRGLDETTTVSIGLALGAMIILATLMFIRIRAGVLNTLGPDADGAAIIIGFALALACILANILIIAARALDGSAEAARLDVLGGAVLGPLNDRRRLRERADMPDQGIAVLVRKAERAAASGITEAGRQRAASDQLIDAARAIHQGVDPLSEPAVGPNRQDGVIGHRRTETTPEVDERPLRLCLEHVSTPPAGRTIDGARASQDPGPLGEPVVNSDDQGDDTNSSPPPSGMPEGRKRPRRRYYQLTNAVALAAAAVIAIVVAIAATVFGLRFSSSPSLSSSPGERVVIVATATANEPAPALPVDVLQGLRSAGSSSAGATANIVAPGTSHPDTISLTPPNANGTAGLDSPISAVEGALKHQANPGQLDLLATIAAAVRTTSSPATLIVVSSGLSTAGGFDLRQVGWDADPSSLAKQLKARGVLPDLAGFQVVFVGLGDTAGRQPPLALPQRATLADYWQAICHAADAASCRIDEITPPQLASHVTSSVPVVPVPVVASVRGPGGIITTSLPDALLFQFDSATLIPAADSVLAPLATQARRQHLRVAITGHASPDGGTNAYNIALSARRAAAVRDRLIALGLPAGQITQVTGVGTAGEPPNACRTRGHLDEAVCAQLRRVVVVLSPKPTP